MFLCRALSSHRFELEADMHEAYGVDVERPGCSALHLACLAAQLGRSSRTFRAVDPACAWGDAEYILANVSDSLAALCYGLSGGRGRAPRPMPRPGAAAKAAPRRRGAPAMTRDQVARALAAPRA